MSGSPIGNTNQNTAKIVDLISSVTETQVSKDSIISQGRVTEQIRPQGLTQDKVLEEINRASTFASDAFRRLGANKLRWSSYGWDIIGIGLGTLAFAFLIYSVVWIATNSNVLALTNGQGVANENTSIVNLISNALYDFNFWFGFAILSFPLSIYIFAFWTYINMLYDSRLTEISKLLAINDGWRYLILREPLRVEFLKKDEEVLTKYSRYKLKVSVQKLISKTQGTKESDDIISSTITNVVRVLSLRMDGSTLSGYYFALILLEVIVAAAFALPAIELTRLGTIGTDILRHIADSKADYMLSLIMAVEWSTFGVFVYSFVTLMERVPRKDVTPRYYLNIALRYIVAIALSALFSLIFERVIMAQDEVFTNGILAACSFVIGMFPNTFFRELTVFVSKWIRGSVGRDIPLEEFTSMNPMEITRLWEEGIYNVDILSDTTVQELYRRTRYSPDRLQGIIGKALLWRHVIGSERMINVISTERKKKNCTIRNNREFRSPDIQTFCSGLFGKEFFKITIDDIEDFKKKNPKDVDNIAQARGIGAEALMEVVALIPNFQTKLFFKGFEYNISDVIKDEYGIDIDQSRPQASLLKFNKVLY